MMRKIILVLLGISLLTACGEKFEQDVYTVEDMCIKQVETSENVCYGMSRAEIEEILGSGTEGSFGWINYSSGVNIAYRDDNAAGLILEVESADTYTTARGAEVGMSKEEIKPLYGKQHSVQSGEMILDYIYDSIEKQPLEQIPSNRQKEMEDVHIFSFMFNDDGADRIMLLDARMAMYFE